MGLSRMRGFSIFFNLIRLIIIAIADTYIILHYMNNFKYKHNYVRPILNAGQSQRAALKMYDDVDVEK